MSVLSLLQLVNIRLRSDVALQSHGRVMLDPVIYDQLQPNNSLVPRIYKPMRREVLTAEHKMMLNPVLYGFSLGDKTWGKFVSTTSTDCY